MSHPGVGPNTALGFVLTIGDVSRFRRARQVASYVGLIPREHSSGGKQRLGRFYRRLAVRRGRSQAKVAVARKLAVRLYWMLRNQWNYAQERR